MNSSGYSRSATDYDQPQHEASAESTDKFSTFVSPWLHMLQHGHSGGPISSAPSLSSLRIPQRGDGGYDVGAQNLVSPVMSRSPSVGSDRFSTVSGLTTHFPSNPTNINPAPAYVATFGAVQVVSEHQAANKRPSSSDGEGESAQPNKDDVRFSEPALSLVNTFLDQLLYSFLSNARSTSLLALRPAVNEVLKHRLAREAIQSAEEELQELLAGGEDEDDVNSKQNASEKTRSWDLELVWKRTRLRVMVYMRLGEMEDDDEERYVKEEELFHSSERRFSQQTGLVSWAAAIFLTSVLEYVAEQTLQVAGQAAYTRARRQSRSARVSSPTDAQKPVIVEEYDVEKVALNSTLGRLWRTWRKALRNNGAPPTPISRFAVGRSSNENMHGAAGLRRGSVGTTNDGSVDGDRGIPSDVKGLQGVPEMQYPEHVMASNIPLPIGDSRRDVDEIEVPGLARDPDVAEEDPTLTPVARRNSFTGMAVVNPTAGLPTPQASPGVPARKPQLVRHRSMSVPTPSRTPIPIQELKDLPGAFPEEAAEEGAPQVAEGTPAAVAGESLTRDATHATDPTAPEASEAADVPLASKELDSNQQSPEAPDTEPKANAEEMAPHKRASQDVQQLLDKVVNNEPPDELDAAHKEKDEHHGLVGGLVAGATAAAAAGAAMVYGTREHRADSSAYQTAKTSLEEPEAQPHRNIEELDKRKSLLDMKSMLGPSPSATPARTEGGVEAPQILTSRQVSVSQPGTPPAIVRTGSEESKESYTLGEGSGERSTEALGAAQGGVGFANSSVNAPFEDQQTEARDVPKRPARLVLGGSTPREFVDSPTAKQNSPRSPGDFLKSRSLTSTTPRPDAQRLPLSPASGSLLTNGTSLANDAALANGPSKRRSISGFAFTNNVAQQSPLLEKASSRQPWSAAQQLEREQQQNGARAIVPSVPSVPIVHRTPIAVTPIKEHPIVQQMAKRNSDRTASPQNVEPERSLTSASIRGPEDFDSFVQQGDTVKYTLTPETARTEIKKQPSRRSTGPVELSSGPSVSRRSREPDSDGRTGRSQVPKQATSATPDNATLADAEIERKRENRKSISRPSPRNVSTHRRSGLMAREPQVMTESTRDFADFIRSTGPNKQQEVTPILDAANRSTTSLHSLRSAHINGSNGSASRASSVASQERTKSMTKSAMEKQNVPPIPAIPAKGSRGMKARTAAGGSNGTSELIDFIRKGPHEEGQQRIPKSVAPFRSTADSEQLKEMGDRINGDKPLDLSLNTNVPSVNGGGSRIHPSQRTPVSAMPASASMNTSQTVHPAHSGVPQRLAGTPISPIASATPDSGRKRYRNKDPYALDNDDDDDNDHLTALPKNARREESLADFLNSTEPPSDNAPKPIVSGGGAQARSVMNKARTTSVNSLRAAGVNGPPDASARTRSMQNNAGPRPGYAASARSVQSAASQHRAQATSPLPSALSKPKPRMEARSPGTNSTDPARSSSRLSAFKPATNELADFLKNSGPEEDPDSAPAPIVGRKSKMTPAEALKREKKVGRGKFPFGLFKKRGKTFLDTR